MTPAMHAPCRTRSRLPAVLCAAIVLAANLLQQAAAVEPAVGAVAPEQLIEKLRGGGLLIYMRHGKTDRTQTDRDRNNLGSCITQRNLSSEGRAQAAAIGAAIRALDIPVGRVLSSPYCRCKDTARLAFGRAEIVSSLRFGMGTDRAETEQLAQALRDMLSTAPQAGRNDVLVSHTANLKEATGIWPEPEGAAYVFMPKADQGFQYLGRIGPEQWQRPTDR